VLGGLIEVNFRRALTYSYGDYSTFYGSPITIGLWVITFLSLVAPVIIKYIKKRIRQE
jgi:putative tricarboxylic transport membrane protein